MPPPRPPRRPSHLRARSSAPIPQSNLALLELSRERVIEIQQAAPYAPIHAQLRGEQPFALAAEIE